MQNPSPLSTLIHSQAKRYGNRVALRYKNPSEKSGPWRNVSWMEFSERVTILSNALLELGVEVQEKLAVFSQNMPECLYIDFAAYAIRAVTIPFFATSSESQVKYMVSDAKVRYIFVGEQYQYETAYRVLKMNSSVCRLIILDPTVKLNEQDHVSISFAQLLEMGAECTHAQEVKKRTAELAADDLANILYTSGTTGLSKGVMLTHRMYLTAIHSHVGVLPLTDKDVVLSFLPYAHVFERSWICLCVAEGCTIALNYDPSCVLASMKEIRPTVMCAVPRFWEKVYNGVQERIERTNPMQRSMLEDALKVGHDYNVKYKLRGLVPPLATRLKYRFYKKTVIDPLLHMLGLDRHHFFPTAGAAVSRRVEEFVHSIGLTMIVGYGMTETTATVSCDIWKKRITPGSVGRILPGVQVKFGDHNEILLKGDTITKGYYRKAEVTDLAFDSEGWFHTGDVGYMLRGELYLTDRLKDLFKTSNAKFIAPQMLESKLTVDRYIDQIVVIAEGKKFVSALIIPEYRLLEEMAQKLGVEYKTRAELCAHPTIVKFMKYRLDTLQQEFAHYEQIKRITLLPEPFSMERGELTNTLKVRRDVLNKNYKAQIDQMYEDTQDWMDKCPGATL